MSYRPARRTPALQLAIVMISSLVYCHTTSAQISDWINPGADNWFNPTNWNLGVPGPGTVARINNGGFALLFDPGGSAAYLWIGSNTASLLTISGPGNLTLHGGDLDVTRGDLRIQNGGFLDVLNHPTLGSSAEIGDFGPATLTVTGANSRLTSGNFYLGTHGPGSWAGSATMRIENGGWVDTTFSARVGSDVSKTTAATVTGAGSLWTIGGVLDMQAGGTATVTIADRGTINAAATRIGQNCTVTVAGSGSSLNNSSTFDSVVVGYYGAGALNVQSGGLVTGLNAVIGSGFTGFIGNGTATVTGAGSRWSVGQNLFVGGDGATTTGNGLLRVQNGGLVQSAMIRVSNSGSVEVDNGSTTVAGLAIAGGTATPNLNNLGDLSIGASADGRMTVTGGGDVWTGTGQIGRNAGRTGSAVVQGAGSTWNNSSDLFVGTSGTGTLEIRNGATVSNFRGHVGFNAGSSGSVLVTDPGSTWSAAGSFFIGNGGIGSLQVLNGATASTAGNSYLGVATFSQGTATVSGAGSTWSTANTLYIGGNADGPSGPFASTLRIENNGLVNAGSTVLYNTGILELTDTATLNSPISSRGGLIRTFGAASHGGPISLNSGNLSVVTFTANTTATLSGVLSGAGGLTKSGLGATAALRLTANNTYSGPTTINNGKLLVDGSITSAATVNNNGTLGGSGTVGPVTVMSGGTLAPGNSVGLLSSGDASFRSGGNYDLEIRTSGAGLPGTDWDSLAVSGALDLSTLSAANRFNVRLNTLAGSGAASPLTDWNPGVDHTWPSIFTTSGGVTGAFDSGLFNIDATNFKNPVHGTFQVVQDGNNFNLFYDATDVADGVLVTNLDQPLRYATPIGNNPNPVDPPEGPGAPWYWAAQQFISDGLPHELVSIQARVGDGSTAPPPVVVAELHADNAGAIGDLIGTFAAPDVSGAANDLVFLPAAPVTLDPGAAYWVLLGSATPGDGTFFWQYINTSIAAGSGQISSFADSNDSGATWSYHGATFPYYLQVNVLTTIPGDFNGDNAVDAADYVVLRNDPGVVPAEFDEWRANFGEEAGSGAGAYSAAIPEPNSALLSLIFVSLATGRASRQNRTHARRIFL